MKMWRRVAALLALLPTLVGAGSLAPAGPTQTAGRTPVPQIKPARAGTQCVEPAAVMRRNHMVYLRHQRDDTVHGGVRGAKYSLKGCIACHASAQTRSVATAEGDFCVSCHSYAAVSIDCFECHTSKAAEVVAAGGLK